MSLRGPVPTLTPEAEGRVCVRKRIFDFQKSFNLQAGIRRFEILKMFYPPKGRLLADSKGVHLFLLMFYLRMGWMGYQKCPSNFFILCGYIVHVYTYLYIYIYTQKL